MVGICSNCGETGELVKGECRTCSTYRRRNGQARPEELVVRAARRFNDRQSERELLGRYTYEY